MNDKRTLLDVSGEYGTVILNFFSEWEYLLLHLQIIIWASLDIKGDMGICVTRKLDVPQLKKIAKLLINVKFPMQEKGNKKSEQATVLGTLLSRFETDKIEAGLSENKKKFHILEVRNYIAHMMMPRFTEDETLEFRRFMAASIKIDDSVRTLTLDQIIEANDLTIKLRQDLTKFTLNYFPGYEPYSDK